MSTTEIHVGNVGTRFLVTILDQDGTAVDISTATTTKILKFKKPDGTVLEKTASFSTDGNDGVIYFDSTPGMLDTDGQWTIQAYVVLGDGREWHSDTKRFTVHSNLS